MIDDDEDFLHLMQRRLQAQRSEFAPAGPIDIHPYTDPVEALVNMPGEGICVVFLDYNLEDSTGLDWLPKLIKVALGPVVLLTNHNDAKTAAEAFHAGAADYIAKSDVMSEGDRLSRAIREAVHRYRLEIRNTVLTRQIKLVNTELENKNKRLAELTETAHQCVDDVAHDFRTPLTVIQQYALLIADGLSGPVTQGQRDHLDVIAEATQDLSEMVDDFLDSSKLRARALSVDRKRHTVQELFDSVAPMLEVRAKPKQIAIEHVVTDNIPSFFGDLAKASRVLSNLVVNAVKVTPQGRSLRLLASTTDAGDVRIAVADEGPGLTPEESQVIFERFQQLSSAQPTGVKGFGLGLSIVQHLTWLNLGKVDIESKPGQGSKFAFSLPAFDLDRILACYLESAKQIDDRSDLWMLHVRSADGSLDAPALRHLVSSHCYPMDVVLDDGGMNVAALGVSSNASAWVNRLQNAIARTKPADAVRPPSGVEIRVEGPWRRDGDAAKLIETLAGCLATGSCNV